MDEILSSYAIPRLNKGEELELEELVNIGKRKSNVDYANKTLGYNPMENFIEYANYGDLDENVLKQARKDVEVSIRNFFKSRFLSRYRQEGGYLIPQRTLRYTFEEAVITGTPDVIAFYENTSLSIIDWKVKASPYTDHHRQLTLYAYLLNNVKPHKDFPVKKLNEIRNCNDIRLEEVHLLNGFEREYFTSDDDFADLEDYIFESHNEMLRILDGKKYPEITPRDIPVTDNPYFCKYCVFKEMCWRDN